jgi:hypothetical protein
MVRLFEMTQLIGFSPAKLLLLLVKKFIEIFPFMYIQYDLLERLKRKHYYPLFALYIDKKQVLRVSCT